MLIDDLSAKDIEHRLKNSYYEKTNETDDFPKKGETASVDEYLHYLSDQYSYFLEKNHIQPTDTKLLLEAAITHAQKHIVADLLETPEGKALKKADLTELLITSTKSYMFSIMDWLTEAGADPYAPLHPYLSPMKQAEYVLNNYFYENAKIANQPTSYSAPSPSHIDQENFSSLTPLENSIIDEDAISLEESFWRDVETSSEDDETETVTQPADYNAPYPTHVDQRNISSLTPLQNSISNGQIIKSEIIIAFGADVNKAWLDGITPLHSSVYSNTPRLVELLLKYIADPNLQETHERKTPLCAAVHIDHNNPSDALIANKSALLELLIAAGANPNIADHQGKTPLMYATESGRFDWANILLKGKVDKSIIDSALMLAKASGHMDLGHILKTHDAGIDTSIALEEDSITGVDTSITLEEGTSTVALLSAVIKTLTEIHHLQENQAGIALKKDTITDVDTSITLEEDSITGVDTSITLEEGTNTGALLSAAIKTLMEIYHLQESQAGIALKKDTITDVDTSIALEEDTITVALLSAAIETPIEIYHLQENQADIPHAATSASFSSPGENSDDDSPHGFDDSTTIEEVIPVGICNEDAFLYSTHPY